MNAGRQPDAEPDRGSTAAELADRAAQLLEGDVDPFAAESIEALAELLGETHEALGTLLDAGAAEAQRVRELAAPAALGEDGRRLHELAAAVAGEGAIAWLRAAARVAAASERLAEGGPPSEIIERGAAEAAHAAALRRVVLSRIDEGWLVVEAVHCEPRAGDEAELQARLARDPVRLEYPLVEAELVRRRRPQVVASADPEASGQRAFAEVMGWETYVAAPIVLGGRTVGFLHGDRGSAEPPPGALEREALWRYAEAFAGAFERAVLHRRLRIQRQELRQVASWADARTGELSDAAIDLAPGRDAAGPEEAARASPRDSQLRELLTRREVDVLEQMAGGESNAEIARALVVSESTVKFHVKNILRKLGASNRAEATSRYLRLGMRSDGG